MYEHFPTKWTTLSTLEKEHTALTGLTVISKLQGTTEITRILFSETQTETDKNPVSLCSDKNPMKIMKLRVDKSSNSCCSLCRKRLILVDV